MSDKQQPIELDIKSADATAKTGTNSDGAYSLRTFDSYAFSRSVLTPADAFRFTAPGVDKALRTAIRSGDMVAIYGVDEKGNKIQIATGFIDETDTHSTPNRVEYVLTGRDVMSQLVDNAAVDASNQIINVKSATLGTILSLLIKNTRIPQGYKPQQAPNGNFVFNTNAGETKICALQRYMDFANCLLWSQPNGQLVLGKPNFAQPNAGSLILKTNGEGNLTEQRTKRAPNRSIRQCVKQIQTLEQVDAGRFTVNNSDPDVQRIAKTLGARSVYDIFSYGQGGDVINLITQVGNQNGSPNAIGASLARREIARANMSVIDVEAVVRGHVNENGLIYNVDQMYAVQIEDDDVNEDMYVYQVEYELTIEHGLLTRLHLCRKGTICADSAILSGTVA